MRYWIQSIVMLLLLNAALQAEPVPQFKDGERVCFVGDSITHGGTYHSTVYLYYLTRFPDREIRAWNKGISGNQASHVLRRFDSDIAVVKPTVSTLMLGMNDVGRSLYGVDKVDADSQRKQKHLMDLYVKNMRALLGKFDAIGNELILITPSIYDQTAEIKAHNNFGVNDALGTCADFVRSTASERGAGMIDFHEPMGSINAEMQIKDPSATLVGADRVHPQPGFGHFIMGYHFLKAQRVPQYVSKMVLDANTGTVIETENGSITGIESRVGTLSFTALEFALPFPQTDFVKKALALVPFESEMNQEVLRVKNLPDGEYALSIDDVAVGHWRASQLSEGINLAVNRCTPQYKQALQVKELNDKRSALQGRLRGAAFTFYGSGLSESGIDLDDPVAVKTYLAEKLKAVEGKSYYNYVKGCYEKYAEAKAQEPQIREEIEALHVELYRVNQPVPHRFRLTAAVEESDDV